MRELVTLFAPFGASLAIYLPPFRRPGFLIASGTCAVMVFLERGEFSWLWGFFAFAFFLGWFAEASPLTAFWAMLGIGVARLSLLSAQSPVSALLLGSALLLFLPSLWEEHGPDLAGASVFILLALLPLLTAGLPDEWRFLLAAVPLLGVFPFHLWVRSAMEDGPSFGSLLLATGLRSAVLLWLGRGGVELPGAPFLKVLLWLGTISILWGALRAFLAEDWGKLCAYAATVEAGVILLLMVRGGIEISLFYSLLAGLSLLVLGAGFWGVKRFMEEGRSITPAVFLLLAGLLASSGLPLTPGFPAIALAAEHLAGWESLLVLAGGLGVMGGGARLLRPIAPAFRPDPSLHSARATALLITAIIFLTANFAF